MTSISELLHSMTDTPIGYSAIITPDRRLAYLKLLDEMIHRYERKVLSALYRDVHKGNYEAYMTELIPVYTELRNYRKYLRKWLRPRAVSFSLGFIGSRTFVQNEPLGTVLIYSPWNYPFQLTILPLIAAIAAGNKVVLSISPSAPETNKVIASIVKETFEERDVVVLTHGEFDPKELLDAPFDHIFYTGRGEYAKVIASHAGNKLIPVTLELGGKSPVFVGGRYDLKLTTRRLAWAKLLNAGQTCVAPDYLLLPEGEVNRFVPALIDEMERHTEKIVSTGMLRIKRPEKLDMVEVETARAKVLYGGKIDRDKGAMQPTIVLNPPSDSPLLSEELFLPLLPIITYRDPNDALRFVNARPKPLALYIYSNDRDYIRHILRHTTSGSVAINDSLMQISHPHLPFGGVGASGTGRYHGKAGLETFSNPRSVLHSSRLIDFPQRYRLDDKWEKLLILSKLM